jgi:hypothetical protein
MDNLAPDEAGEPSARIRPCQLHANCREKIIKVFQVVIWKVRHRARRRARTAEH